MMRGSHKKKVAVFDFFCGCGGTSSGFKKAGMDIVFALDIDSDAKATFTKNFPDTAFSSKSIRQLTYADLQPILEKHSKDHILFCGCAPCQPFTRQNTSSPKRDSRKNLLSRFGRIIERHLPDLVFVENVPGLQNVPKHKSGPLPAFEELLSKLNYHISYGVVAAQDYGTPQLRRRFVLLASKHGEIHIPEPTHGAGRKNPYKTVFDAIGDLPPIAAGENFESSVVFNHRAAALSDLNLKRIKASNHNGGGRKNWPVKLWPKCYLKEDEHGNKHTGHTDCYGRLWWNKPATGLTTRCISYSNGRFGHPEQDRSISVREAARLQGFDDNFEFTGNLSSMAKQIGNAVPVDLAFSIGKQIIEHFEVVNG
jgi:DNA (cytosine-5)-methyltransferase 1